MIKICEKGHASLETDRECPWCKIDFLQKQLESQLDCNLMYMRKKKEAVDAMNKAISREIAATVEMKQLRDEMRKLKMAMRRIA